MSRLASHSIDNLKKEAKRWLKAIRENDTEARARFEKAHPKPSLKPQLRDVHHALAREQGFSGWIALTEHLASAAMEDKTHADRVARFIQNACPDHRVRGPRDHVVALKTAERLLQQHPEIARDSFYTAIVCGELAEVSRVLAERPEAAREKGGPKGWEPLLYLCFTRFPHHNAVAIARALLDNGADPTVYFMAGDSQYTPLTGVIGEGEEDRPGHPQREQLTQLLLDRGANPFDVQVLYNVHFHGDIIWYLDMIYAKTRDTAPWTDPEWPMIDEGGYGQGARFFMTIALDNNNVELAGWMLEHGAGVNPADARASHMRGVPYEIAVKRGFMDLAELLVRYGAEATQIAASGVAAFHAAVLRLDRDTATKLAAEHPEYLRDPSVMMHACKHDLVDAVALLLDLGMSIEIKDPSEGSQRPLHAAAYRNSLRVARLLVDRGAEIDPLETNFRATPLSFAVYANRVEMVRLLSPYTRRMPGLVVTGNIARIQELLRESPELAKFTHPGTYTLLMELPEDESRAIEIAELLMAHGADPAIRNPKGETAADMAERRGMLEVAVLLRAKAAMSSPQPLFDIDERRTLRPRHQLTPAEWDTVVAAMEQLNITDLNTESYATDAALRKVSRLPLRRLNMNGSRNVTSAGVEHLARCESLEYVEMMQTPTGDAALAALRNKPRLRHLKSGVRVTDAGLAHLQEYPVFKTWQGGEEKMALLEFAAEPNYLVVRGSFTDAGLAHFRGLDGLFALNLDDRNLQLTGAGLEHLASLPRLAWLGFDANDATMPQIAALPHLRFLMCQDTDASDDGFAALSASKTLEYIWGRRCYNLMDRGFTALSQMPSLRGLSVGCKNVADSALASLPDFPKLRELMPMDFQDASFRHIARCPDLEALYCMYCRETTDAATEHIAGLSKLATYYAGYNLITDRSLEILAGMPSLEKITLSGCAGVTNAGVARLAALPRLRELRIETMPQITAVPEGVRVIRD